MVTDCPHCQFDSVCTAMYCWNFADPERTSKFTAAPSAHIPTSLDFQSVHSHYFSSADTIAAIVPAANRQQTRSFVRYIAENRSDLEFLQCLYGCSEDKATIDEEMVQVRLLKDNTPVYRLVAVKPLAKAVFNHESSFRVVKMTP